MTALSRARGLAQSVMCMDEMGGCGRDGWRAWLAVQHRMVRNEAEGDNPGSLLHDTGKGRRTRAARGV